MPSLTESTAWQALQHHSSSMQSMHMKDLFAGDHGRFAQFSIDLPQQAFLLDFSRQRVTQETLRLLQELAVQQQLPSKIQELMRGLPVNFTEERPAHHTALRQSHQDETGQTVHAGLTSLFALSEKIRQGKWYGFHQDIITDVVNIGIGGSDLGPQMGVAALTSYHQTHCRFHFVSNIDGNHINETLKSLNPATTLFIISSKSFTTLETLANAITAKQWLQSAAGSFDKVRAQFIAITANTEKALQFGIRSDLILPLWDWVGGRYSIWSSIGFPIAIAIGETAFKAFLRGAEQMDEHTRTAPVEKNIAIMLALLDIWNINFLGANTLAVLPYNQYLKNFPSYIKQLMMESNGKQVNTRGETVNYATGPIVWGEVGCNGQHAFHQLLYQGTHLTPIDFIVAANGQSDSSKAKTIDLNHHQDILFANCISQAEALMLGKTKTEAYQTLIEEGLSPEDALRLAPHHVIPGNQPSNVIMFDSLTPEKLGMLIALYEHRTYLAACIWEINPFDQMSVEFGKKLSRKLVQKIHHHDGNESHQKNSAFNLSAAGALKFYEKHNQSIKNIIACTSQSNIKEEIE